MIPLSVGSIENPPCPITLDFNLFFLVRFHAFTILAGFPYHPLKPHLYSHPLFTTYTSIQGSFLYALFTIP